MICKCGHSKEVHRENEVGWFDRCLECIQINPLNRTYNLHVYKPDNLIFLEEIAYQKGFEQYSIAKKSRARKYYNR